MKLNRLLLLGAFIAFLGNLQAQDIHFSLFNMSPLTLNPALTGAYEGTARVGGTYRDQWSSFLPNQFTTPSFFIDAPIIRGFRETDWVGVGMLTVNDQAGTANLRTTENMLAASYHFALTKDAKTMLTLGLQGGSVQRSLDLGAEGLLFGDESELAGGQPGTSDDRNLNDEKNFFDFNAGLLFRTELDDQSSLDVGLAFNHITQPDYSLNNAGMGGADAQNRPMTIVAHTTYRTQLTEKLGISPTLLLQNTSGATAINLQAWGNYLLKEEIPAEKQPEVKLNFGAGYRFGDAAQVLAGLDYGPLRVALSYDVNVSSLSEVSNFQGGFEVAAWYVFKIYKKPNTDPNILCPRF